MCFDKRISYNNYEHIMKTVEFDLEKFVGKHVSEYFDLNRDKITYTEIIESLKNKEKERNDDIEEYIEGKDYDDLEEYKKIKEKRIFHISDDTKYVLELENYSNNENNTGLEKFQSKIYQKNLLFLRNPAEAKAPINTNTIMLFELKKYLYSMKDNIMLMIEEYAVDIDGHKLRYDFFL